MTAEPPGKGKLRTLVHAIPLAVILLGGIFLRCYRLFDLPPGPWIDEAYALRAAREATAGGWSHLPASAPLQPPGTAFVNFWITGPYLAFASSVDHACGGGIASFRALSTFPALLLFAGGVLLAREAFRPRRKAPLLAAVVLASSSWLLSTSRWGWVANFSAALVVFSAFLALRAARAESRTAALSLSASAGALLGLAQYGYPSAWMVAPVPLLVLAAAWIRRRGDRPARLRFEAAAAAAAGLVLTVAPLAWHYAAHPERAAARPRELSVATGGAGPAVRKLAENVRDYGRLFLTGGDENERHGDPARPVLPVAVSGLAAVGLAATVRASRLRMPALAAALLVLGGLLSGGEGPNAFRISAAATFLVILSIQGGLSLVERLPAGLQASGRTLLAGTLVLAGTLEAASFLDWLSSPRLFGAFGGPERELADAIGGEIASGRAGGVLLDPRAARNPWVVDVLLAPPSGGGARALHWAPLSRESARLARASGRAVVIAAPRTVEALETVGGEGGLVFAESTPLEGFPGWVLFRVGPIRAGPPGGGLPAPRSELR